MRAIADVISLEDLIRESELRLLFESSLSAGLTSVSLWDGKKTVLLCGEPGSGGDALVMHKALYLEGEETGEIRIEGPARNREMVEIIGELVYDAVRAIMLSSYRALLVAEARKTVVAQSYEELIDRNARLSESEGKYRRLSESLREQIGEHLSELKRVQAELESCKKNGCRKETEGDSVKDIGPALGSLKENLRSLKTCFARMKRPRFNAGRQGPRKRCGTDAGDGRNMACFRDAERLIKESMNHVEHIEGMISFSNGAGKGRRPGNVPRNRKKVSGGSHGEYDIDRG